MATGRIGTTPALGFRWSIEPAGGTTSLSGLDNNSVGLSYTPGNERVYRNGVLLSRVNDYTATSGNSITLNDATVAGDIIEVFSQDLTQLADTIARSTLTAKGQVLTATAASTPAVLAVGANGTVLTADSAETTGLKWATPATGGSNWTLVNAGGTSLTGAATVTVSGISGADQILILVQGASSATSNIDISWRVNADTANNYFRYGWQIGTPSTYSSDSLDAYGGATNGVRLGTMGTNAAAAVSGYVLLTGCNTSGVKAFQSHGGGNSAGGAAQQAYNFGGYYNSASTISSISIVSASGNLDAGTVFVYRTA